MLQNNMKFYQEITLIPSQEINKNFLMGKIFCSLHHLFVKNQIDGVINVGISFPEYDLKNKTLGTKIRLFFNSNEASEKINLKEFLKVYEDYIHITNLRETPSNVKYAIFKRVQKKGNKYRLARRYSKRKNVSYKEAIALYDKYDQKMCILPYIKLKSSSNGSKYNIFIERIDSEKPGCNFNLFGLCINSGVPIF